MKDEINKIVNWIEMGYTRLNYKEELSLVDYIKQLQQENKHLKERIRKAIELNKQVIKDTKEFYRPTKDIIYSGDTLIDIAEQNLKILKEVNK